MHTERMRIRGRRPLGTDADREDLLIAGLVGGGGILEIALGAVTEHRAAALLAMGGMAVALAVRRRFPLSAAPVVLILLVGQSVAGVDANAQVMTLPAIIVASYSMSRHARPRPSLVGLGASLGLVAAAIVADGSSLADLGFGWLLVGAPWTAGHAVRRHAAAAAASDAEARQVAAAARERVARAADEERARIARELHDIVFHGLTAMVVQATAAEQLVGTDPDGAAAAMRQVQATGREAMDDMKHLLGLLRAPEHPSRDPQPALDDLTHLVEAARAAGSETRLEVTGEPRPLPRGLALSIYRIAQEALTNVRKHAGNAAAEVHLRFQPASVCLEVLDQGPRRPDAATVPGYGLTGIRERAELYGGRMEAAPRTDVDGWRVRVEFPLAAT